jgi:hypothetical protein
VYDELSVSFENPATDPMGYNHVVGKLYCGRDYAELQFKVRDRAFKETDPKVVRIKYGEVESVDYSGGWFRPSVLILATRSPEKLSEFPGVHVGRIEFQVIRGSRSEAKKVEALIRFKQSEAFLAESEERLQEKRSEP